ncbi:MAG: N-acetylmuramoyl-L-alanine amidase [Deltaproteobacteria bacterium]|uniref:N-acetylmuramoyl-L-alanine amidase n=1 Tax=Candidatus Zymogenus saltonus TaxID=2844893 RepID=A0A9D8PPM8_9DELT|nr:N-acetylmuramoyl-L-alanine amidase [Candidatus Zymogenus saltonus]
MLTLDYIHKHYDPKARSIEITPKMIVLHWTAICGMEASWNTFNRVHISANRTYIARYGDVNVSVHFLVDRDGTIYRLMPETTMARHTIGLNWCAIGVENVGSNSVCTLTGAQVESNAALVRYLAGKYGTIEYLIGHYEYGAFRGTPLWKGLIPDYFTHKIDPGESFMAGVRGRLTDLDLKSGR